MPPGPYPVFWVYLSALQNQFVVTLFYTLWVELLNCRYLCPMKEIKHTCQFLQGLTAPSRNAATGPEITIVLFLHDT